MVLPGRVARQAACAASGPAVPAASMAVRIWRRRVENSPSRSGRDAVDLRDALDRCGPGQAEALGELAAEHRVVEVGGGQGVPVDLLRVHRGPLAIRAVQQVRHDQVGVQLRVVGPGGAVLEPGDDPAVGADPLRALAVALMAAQPVPGHRSRKPTTSVTAAWWAARTCSAVSGSPSPNSTLTDFGAETVTSIPGRRLSTRRPAYRSASANGSLP